MWHLQKKGTAKELVELLKNGTGLSLLSEQTLYTIANDMAEFKEYEDGEVIVRQDQKSNYNLNYMKEEFKAIDLAKNKDKDYLLSQKVT